MQGVADDLEFVYAYQLTVSVILRGCSRRTQVAHIAQSVEHILGKDEVTGSIPVVSSHRNPRNHPVVAGVSGLPSIAAALT